MGIFQAFNKRSNAWVKYKVTAKGSKKGSKICDVKQRNPRVPFKGIAKRGKGL